MASNNYGILTHQPAVVKDNERGYWFVALSDDGQRKYSISLQRISHIPPLPTVEYNGRPIIGNAVQALIDMADESFDVDFGNGNDGYYMRHGETFTTVAHQPWDYEQIRAERAQWQNQQV